MSALDKLFGLHKWRSENRKPVNSESARIRTLTEEERQHVSFVMGKLEEAGQIKKVRTAIEAWSILRPFVQVDTELGPEEQKLRTIVVELKAGIHTMIKKNAAERGMSEDAYLDEYVHLSIPAFYRRGSDRV